VAETGDRSPLKLPLAKPRIVVKKSKRQLLLFSDGKLLRTYRIGLGLSPLVTKYAKVIGARRKAPSISSPATTRAPTIFRWVSAIPTRSTPSVVCAMA